MATILWEHEINKNVDWGGDITTGGAPVSGKYVQQFIKDTLAKKFGYLYFDRTNLKYLIFVSFNPISRYPSITYSLPSAVLISVSTMLSIFSELLSLTGFSSIDAISLTMLPFCMSTLITLSAAYSTTSHITPVVTEKQNATSTVKITSIEITYAAE